ncbi:hypothetical protein ASD04_00250 [Devosia sp. Root436]|jgi:hypothetical protein|uniref:hypothetical protein n=1 Tax=Devosia sp. Root436 TaxID=1736537 RepID=UPI0006F6905B|nr:hypothetical protein [Devosia sp. Root436]KQX42439.1 hypothetical protein ASD04_00250 [Devosia sp. Root436]
MLKTTVLAVLVGLASAATTLPSAAQFLAGPPNFPSNGYEEDCAYPLNYMPRVTRAHIQSIDGQPVYLVPVCEDGLIGRNDDYGWLFVHGNVDTLRLPIARNDTLMAALTAQGYDSQDVISLRFGGGDSITLYVHQRNLR